MSDLFRLDSNFVSKYRTRPVPFGFSGLGEVVYSRTYSRLKPDGTKETWTDTIERVVNGTYNMQKRWIESHSLGWDKIKAQESAQEMYDRMWNMKFLPPGRGLWAQGSPLTEERRLYAALNNCAFVSTENIANDLSKPFCFLMDMSMLGCGVGFDTKGAGSLFIHRPNISKTETYEIPDSREGWVNSIKLLLESFFIKNKNKVEFDYSLVRPAGETIKGFGGVSSGPEPLKNLHESIIKTLEKDVGKNITITAIADICNMIGCCVVAGNVRRTALIALGDPDSEEFTNLKNYDVNPERMSYGWTSNNSVFAEIGMDYKKFEKNIKFNGEPGFAWLDNMRYYGRMNGEIDRKDHRVMGTNPCVAIDTIILTNEGLRSVKELIGKQFTAIVDGKPYKSTSKGFWKTGELKHLYKLELSNGLFIRATSNHLILTSDNNWVELGKLQVGDSVKISNNTGFKWTGGEGTYEEGYKFGNISTRIENRSGILPENKSFDYTKGLINCLFDKNSVIFKDKSLSINIKDYNYKKIETIQRILLSVGINSFINKRWSTTSRHGCYIVEQILVNELIIYGENILKFRDIFGFPTDEFKNKKLDKYISEVYDDYFSPDENEYCSKITSITLDSVEDVYDATIPEVSRFVANGIIVHNCVEQSLESYEICNLVECFPTRCNDLSDFLRTLKFAYLYSKTVSLGKTHWSETNRILLRNRRIGCSLSGIAQFLGKYGIEELRQWCEEGYETIQKYDNIYSEWLCIPKSIKTTSIKPSGTVSLLAGATPGIHYPQSRYYIRRMRLSEKSELIDGLRSAGFHIEPDTYSAGTLVVEFPVDCGEGIRTIDEVTMWEQLSLVSFMQRHYADNQVSATITFDPDTEGDQIANALNFFQYQLKGISFLPKLKEGAYAQMPYEKIDAKQYQEKISKLKPLRFNDKEDSTMERFCDGESCVFSINK